MAWTQPRIDELTKMWGDGLSAGQCGKVLNMSRSAIIGKVHRLGLPGRMTISSVVSLRRPQGSAGAALARAIVRRRRISRVTAQTPPPSAPAAATVPTKQRKTLVELDNHHCRFPYGDPCKGDFFFCGDPSADLLAGMPYCRAHAFKAYQAPEDVR